MKWLKKIMPITLIVILCLFTTWFIIKKFYLVDMVHSRIEKSIEENIENDFQFTFDDFEINWFSHSAKLNGINLFILDKTDTVGYFRGNIALHIRGWRNIFFDETKIIENIVLTKADIYYAADHPLTMKNDNDNKDKKVEISNVSASGKLNLSKKSEEQIGQLTSHFDLSVNLNYDSAYEFSPGKILNQVSNFEVTKFHYYLPDGFYQVKINEIAFTHFDDISLKDIIINPVDSRKTFAIRKKVATDYICVAIDSIYLSDFDSHINEKFYADKIDLFQPSIDVFKDKNYPEDLEYTAILVDLLQELKTPVHVKTLAFHSMYIKYTELANQAKLAGNLFFSNANSKILNITNVPDSLKISKNMFIEANAKFYGKGKLETTINYNLLSSSGKFDVQGSMSSMNIVKVNDIISKLVPVRVESGQLESLRFDFGGSRNHTDGELWLEYSDLKIELLEVDYLNSDFTQNLMSDIGNLVLRNSNPDDNGIFKIGDIDQDRLTNKSMFNYWWVSLQSGFLSTLGVTAEKQKIDYQSGEPATFSDKIE